MVENNTKEWGEYVYKKELGILLFRSHYGGTGIYGVPGYLFLRCDKGEADPAAAYHVSAGSGDLVISVHFSVKYHKEKTKYTKYKIDKSLTYTFTLTYGDKVETVTDFSQIEYAIKWLAKYRTGHVEIAVTPTMGSLKKFYICYTDKDPYIHMLIEQERDDGVGYWEERGDSYKIPIMTLERLYVKHKMISFDYLNRRETGVDAREGLIL